MTTFYTLKRNVRLLPGQILGFVKGKGYYAKVKGKPVPKPERNVGLFLLNEAKKHLGVTESPPGSNKTPFGAWFGVNLVPWCAIFMSYCAAHSTGFLIADTGFPGSIKGKGNAYVPGIESWARSTGRWRTVPRPGFLAIYNWDGGAADHAGVVDVLVSPTTFYAIEGNTSLDNNSNGGAVMRRNRSVSQCDGFVDLGTIA